MAKVYVFTQHLGICTHRAFDALRSSFWGLGIDLVPFLSCYELFHKWPFGLCPCLFWYNFTMHRSLMVQQKHSYCQHSKVSEGRSVRVWAFDELTLVRAGVSILMAAHNVTRNNLATTLRSASSDSDPPIISMYTHGLFVTSLPRRTAYRRQLLRMTTQVASRCVSRRSNLAMRCAWPVCSTSVRRCANCPRPWVVVDGHM